MTRRARALSRLAPPPRVSTTRPVATCQTVSARRRFQHRKVGYQPTPGFDANPLLARVDMRPARTTKTLAFTTRRLTSEPSLRRCFQTPRPRTLQCGAWFHAAMLCDLRVVICTLQTICRWCCTTTIFRGKEMLIYSLLSLGASVCFTLPNGTESEVGFLLGLLPASLASYHADVGSTLTPGGTATSPYTWRHCHQPLHLAALPPALTPVGTATSPSNPLVINITIQKNISGININEYINNIILKYII